MIPILVVDDAREDAALATRALAQCKILNPLRALHSGQECLDYFATIGQRSEGTLPCVVLLDLSMKPVSGLDVLRKLKDDPRAADSLFVMLSGVSDYSVVRDGYQLGASTFLVKPLRGEDLLRSFKNLRGLEVRSEPEGHLLMSASGKTGHSTRPVPSARL